MAAKRISSMFMSGSNTTSDKHPTPSASISVGSVSATSTSRESSSHVPRKSLPSQSAAIADSNPHSSELSHPTLQDIRLGIQDDAVPSPLLPPPTIAGGPHSRSLSADYGSRPGTPTSLLHSRPTTPSLTVPGSRPITPNSPASNEKQKLKKGNAWFNGKKKEKDQVSGPVAWIAGHPQKLPYEVDGLLHARPEIELCNEVDGDCFVHLWPKSSGRGASFKVNHAVFAASPILTKLAYEDNHGETITASRHKPRASLEKGTQRLSLEDPSPNITPYHRGKKSSSVSSVGSEPRTSHSSDRSRGLSLYLPLSISFKASTIDANVLTDDMQKLIDTRNLFAFLCGQSLVATERKHSFFDIFMTIAQQLSTYAFSNMDGSTFGRVAHDSFEMYIDELQLADVRRSREKTIESIVLSEHMKSVLLYNEAFTHGVGKYQELIALKSPKFELISRVTQNRLVIAVRDLDKRIAAIREILTDFSFPSLFSGIMSSKMSEERKEGVRFESWKEAFLGTRKFILSSLQQRYGHWPPKARSKKNDLETSGLNRAVLVELYNNLAGLYDLLVDRRSLTSRTVDGIGFVGAREEPMIRALRTVLSEYDRSSPPVKPPVPFDIPQLPTLKTTRPEYGSGDKKLDAKVAAKKLKDDEILKILRPTWDPDAILTPFVDDFREMEKRAAHGCNISEMQDLRVGQWIFMYAVIQALPMLAIDAPGILYTQGVEYFLCESPRNGVPWAQPAASSRPGLSLGDSSEPVSLPADLIGHGVESIYRRSHCWQLAEKWTAANPTLNEALQEQQSINQSSAGANHAHAHQHSKSFTAADTNLLDPNPAPLHPRSSYSRDSSPSRGFETLAPPTGAVQNGHLSRPASPAGPAHLRPRTPVHAVDASKTFDAILADVGGPAQAKGKSGKKGKK